MKGPTCCGLFCLLVAGAFFDYLWNSVATWDEAFAIMAVIAVVGVCGLGLIWVGFQDSYEEDDGFIMGFVCWADSKFVEAADRESRPSKKDTSQRKLYRERSSYTSAEFDTAGAHIYISRNDQTGKYDVTIDGRSIARRASSAKAAHNIRSYFRNEKLPTQRALPPADGNTDNNRFWDLLQ